MLLSEFLLQQTRVDTALPYFQRFVTRWPSLEALAQASDEEVLGEWAGLGYYSRARRLLACARAAVDRGGLPSTAEALQALPGVGPYTAGAIASIAFQQAVPLVDGNVERVLCRLDGERVDPRSVAGRRWVWARAHSLVSPDRPGDLNQALMELGATVCSPKRPGCERCPLASACVARAEGCQEELPALQARTPPQPIEGVVIVWERDGQVLLGQRPSTGLLAGLWEPLSLWPSALSPEDAVRTCLAQELGAAPHTTRYAGALTHVFSHRRLRLHVFAVDAVAPPLAAEGRGSYYADLRWVPVDAPSVPLSTLAKKALRLAALGAQP